jgi:hypothetical protein
MSTAWCCVKKLNCMPVAVLCYYIRPSEHSYSMVISIAYFYLQFTRTLNLVAALISFCKITRTKARWKYLKVENRLKLYLGLQSHIVLNQGQNYAFSRVLDQCSSIVFYFVRFCLRWWWQFYPLSPGHCSSIVFYSLILTKVAVAVLPAPSTPSL